MLFNSYQFMIFFPVVTLLYFVIPRKVRYIWLLLASYVFYMSWNPKYALLILFSTVVTWLSGVVMGLERVDTVRKKKAVVAVSFTVNILILLIFKYLDFLIGNINLFLAKANISLIDKPFDIILPIGISFYTFQALSYTVDVYRGDVKPEKNFLKYALFVSFFPQLVAGPIERSKRLLDQIHQMEEKKNLWDCKRVLSGLIMMLWGLFLKMVIADRISIVVDTIFADYVNYGTLPLILGAVSFAIQIYCDFMSYSTIAIGAAEVMGFTLMENFNTPYLATSIKDFWRRWHISLSTWFRDYLYIPLGGNRCGKVRKYLNVMITFLVSGLWHGSNWTYVFWGGLHGIYQVVGELLMPLRGKIRRIFDVDTDTAGFKIGQILGTFILTDFAWIFFRAESIKEAFGYIGRMFTKWDGWAFFDVNAYDIGISHLEVNIIIVSLIMLLIVSLIKYFKGINLDEWLLKQNVIFRCVVLFVLLMFVIIYGEYGPGSEVKDFIYFQF